MGGWIEALNALPLAGYMLVITLGYSLGRLSWRDISPGPAAATLLCALLLGYVGVRSGTGEASGFTLGDFGFALFIYSVGFDAAPHFASSFREARGWRFVMVGVVVNVIAVALTLVAASVFSLDASSAAGVLAGALTSAPTYAAAAEVAPDSTAISLAFAITYPFGLVGLVLLIQLVPRLLGSDLSRDTVSEDEIDDLSSGRRLSGPSPEVTRAFEVREEDSVGRTLRDLDLTRRTGCVISRLRQADEVIIPTGDSVLELGDRVMAIGRVDELRVLQSHIGPEVDAQAFEGAELPTRRIQVRQPGVVGQSLADLRILNEYRCVITRIERGSLWVEPDANVTLVRNDVLQVVGRRKDLRALAAFMGTFEVSLAETDIAVYAGGILLGSVLGSIHLRAFGVDLGLGMAGGLLLVGLVLGWQQRLGPIRTHVPREARQLVRDLGILLFVGEAGLAAGAGLVEGFGDRPGQTLLAGVAVNVLTVGGALAIARLAFRLRPVDAWGSLCGGLTSTAALQAVRRASDSNEAALSYATAYAVASVIATLAGPAVILLLR